MKKMAIINAISLNMLSPSQKGRAGNIFYRPVGGNELKEIVRHLRAASLMGGGPESYVGHENTAKVFSSVLGIEIPPSRGSYTLSEDFALLGQYVGPRLPEGATCLPEGAEIHWFLVCWDPIKDQVPTGENDLQRDREKQEIDRLKEEVESLRKRLDPEYGEQRYWSD